MGSDKVDIIGSAVSFSAMPTAEFSKWFKTNGDLLIDALANGYEVEKEQLYYVKFDILYLQKYLVKMLRRTSSICPTMKSCRQLRASKIHRTRNQIN